MSEELNNNIFGGNENANENANENTTENENVNETKSTGEYAPQYNDNESANNTENAESTENTSENSVPRVDEEGWIWFDKKERQEAQPHTAQPYGTSFNGGGSYQQSYGNYSTPEAPKETVTETANEKKEKKEKTKTGKGVKVYMALMTAALVAVAAMLGLCIAKLNGKTDTGASKDTPATVAVADSAVQTKNDGNEKNEADPKFTVKYSDGSTDGDLTALYNESSKSCVSILCDVTVSGGFFGQSYSGQSLGSGFVIDKSGYIVTNQHVVEDAEKITVQFYDGEQVEAKLVGSDEACDLAVLKISIDRALYPVTFGNSDNVQIGQKVYAIGTPSNIKLAGTLTYGVVSGIKRQVSLTNDSGSVVKTMTLIQTDATLNPGNSGGPLFNMDGEVIGINTLKLSSDYEGIGFSIPSTGAVDVINELIEHGSVNSNTASYVTGTAKLGITGATVNDESIKEYNLPENTPSGVYVVSVSRRAAVYKEGLSAEDIITEFNGTKVTSIDQLKELLEKCKAGETATIKYFRIDRRDDSKGEYFEITFKLDANS